MLSSRNVTRNPGGAWQTGRRPAGQAVLGHLCPAYHRVLCLASRGRAQCRRRV